MAQVFTWLMERRTRSYLSTLKPQTTIIFTGKCKLRSYGKIMAGPVLMNLILKMQALKTFGLWTRNSVYPVYYHDPRDKTDVLTPEIMEDAAKLLFMGIMSIANDEML